MASFKCKDMGMKCDFEVKDENQDELIHIVTHHLEKTHNMKVSLPPDQLEKVRQAIKK
jgi:predicted small metal-binding protein